MTKTIAAAILVSIVVPASAQQARDPVGDYMKAGSAYRACVIKYAERFASTPESPNDIASAALSACGSEIATFHATVLVLGKLDPAFKDDKAILENFSAGNRNEAIRAVLEKRYK